MKKETRFLRCTTSFQDFDNISMIRESNIRYECRSKYRFEGSMENPHQKGTIDALVWGEEALAIRMEIDKSGGAE